MHFFNRQYWHRFLFILKIEHCWFLVQGLYWIFCCMERRKKPWGLQLQLESRSGSELSSLEQPESLDSRRASSMLTSTECRSRSSAPQAIPSTIHYRAIHSLATSTACPSHWQLYRISRERALSYILLLLRCTVTADGRQRTVRALRRTAHSYPRDLLAGRRPTRESESASAPAHHFSPFALLTVHAALECVAATAPVRRI